jgi:tripartite-type tricarboxylate transporter receptor subunit TctC
MKRLAVTTVSLCLATSALAQSYPTKPVRYIVLMSPGSGADAAARARGHDGEATRQHGGLSDGRRILCRLRNRELVRRARAGENTVGALHKASIAALKNPGVAQRMAELGFIAVGNTPDEFGLHIRSEIEKLAKILAPLRGTVQ